MCFESAGGGGCILTGKERAEVSPALRPRKLQERVANAWVRDFAVAPEQHGLFNLALHVGRGEHDAGLRRNPPELPSLWRVVPYEPVGVAHGARRVAVGLQWARPQFGHSRAERTSNQHGAPSPSVM